MGENKFTFNSDQAAALRALESFMDRVRDYGQKRNLVEAGHPYVSGLSEVIKTRLIAEYEVVDAILEREPFGRVEKYIQEVYWRLYWKGWLEWHPQVWHQYQSDLAACHQNLGAEQQQRCHRLEAGETGVKIMDRFAQELVTTGYLHNHARMWFAGYWIHVCGLPWQWGADFFYRHLLDADAASNTLSWRWVAGLQTQGKHYLPRATNIAKYCRYPEAADPQLREQLTVNEAVTQEYVAPPRLEAWEATAVPEITEPYVLWVHGEDLSFWEQEENMPSREADAAVAVRDEELIGRYALSSRRNELMREALDDGATRWELSKGSEVSMIDGRLVASMVQAANVQRVTVLAGILPGVGPLRNMVPELKAALQQQGIRLVLWRRPEDERVLPQARRGFFPFWKSIRARWA